MHPQIRDYFTASEWTNMLSDSATKSTVLANILGRVHKLDLQHEKLVRDQEAIEYITLPATPDDMRRDYSWQFQAAYPEASGLPMRAPPEIEQEVIFMDASFRCRGQATSESCSVAVQPLECCLAAQPLQWHIVRDGKAGWKLQRWSLLIKLVPLHRSCVRDGKAGNLEIVRA